METQKTDKPLKVLVYGGTGSQASPTVWKLLERGHIPYVLTRNPEKAKAMEEAGAHVVIGNTADLESLKKASKGMDAIALMTPFFTEVPPATTAKNAIDAAVAQSVPFVVWNTSGKPGEVETGNPFLDHQHQTTRYLAESGLKYIILQPTVYLENLYGPYTAPFVVNENKLTYPHPEDMEVHWMASEDMGSFVVSALERPELSGSRFEVAGTQRLNGSGLAAEFSKGLGRKIDYKEMPPYEFAAILNNAFGPGAGDAIAKDYQQLFDEPEKKKKYLLDVSPVLEKLPVTTTPVSEWVSKNKAAFSK
jgi:uncharacterized protein YbjT (DUF2867 family)